MAITKDQVFAIADEMFAKGDAPSLVGLRQRLGTGSYSTIAAFLTEWKSASRSDIASAVELPEELEPVAIATARTMWAACNDHALGLIKFAEDECAARVAEAREGEAVAVQLADSIQAEFDAIFAKNATMFDELETSRIGRRELSSENAALQATIYELRQTNADLMALFKVHPSKVVAKPVISPKLLPVAKPKAKARK